MGVGNILKAGAASLTSGIAFWWPTIVATERVAFDYSWGEITNERGLNLLSAAPTLAVFGYVLDFCRENMGYEKAGRFKRYLIDTGVNKAYWTPYMAWLVLEAGKKGVVIPLSVTMSAIGLLGGDRLYGMFWDDWKQLWGVEHVGKKNREEKVHVMEDLRDERYTLKKPLEINLELYTDRRRREHYVLTLADGERRLVRGIDKRVPNVVVFGSGRTLEEAEASFSEGMAEYHRGVRGAARKGRIITTFQRRLVEELVGERKTGADETGAA